MKMLSATAVAIIYATTFVSGFAEDLTDPVNLNGHANAITAIAWAADGKTVLTAGDDRTVRTWDPATGKQVAIIPEIAAEGYGGPVVAFDADLKVFAVNYWGKIAIRSLIDGKVLVRIDPILDRNKKTTFRPDVYAMSFSPDGKRLATAGSLPGPSLPSGVVIVWDATTGMIIHRSIDLSTAAGTVAWSADGKRYAAGTNGVGGELPEPGEVLVWEADSGKQLLRFRVKPKVEYGEWASTGDVAFGSSNNKLATTSTAGSRSAPAGLIIQDTGASIQIWDLDTGKSKPFASELKTTISRIAFSPDGKILATVGKDKAVQLWGTESGQSLSSITCADAASAIAFSHDGKSLAVGNQNGLVQIFKVTAK